jgi:acetyltransferase-like isoleucine patch superfamily enzyme
MKKILYRLLKRILFKLMEILIKDRSFQNHYIWLEKQYYTEAIRKKLKYCGTGVKINGRITVTDPEFCVLGNNVHIGGNCYFSTIGGLTIGDNTHISRNVSIYTNNHNYQGDVLPYDNTNIYKSVFIGKNVWIGMNVNIVPGVSIGDGAIIGMGTTVTVNIPALAIVGSPPLRVIKQRDPKHYEFLEADGRYGGINGAPLSKVVKESFKQNLFVKDNEHKLFFVVSTGRSGSTTISNVLSQHPDIRCAHEPNKQLIRISTEYLYKIKSKEQVKEDLKRIYSAASVSSGIFYGESDQKLVPLIPILAELFPHAKFVWLIRNGVDVVSSTYSRGWFADNELMKARESNHNEAKLWQLYRVNAGAAGDMSEDSWNKMTSFEKNCWYWRYYNNLIKREFGQLGKERQFFIRLEDFNNETLADMLKFLGVSKPFNFVVTKDNVARQPLRIAESWSEIEKKQFTEICSEMMKELNYSNAF